MTEIVILTPCRIASEKKTWHIFDALVNITLPNMEQDVFLHTDSRRICVQYAGLICVIKISVVMTCVETVSMK